MRIAYTPLIVPITAPTKTVSAIICRGILIELLKNIVSIWVIALMIQKIRIKMLVNNFVPVRTVLFVYQTTIIEFEIQSPNKARSEYKPSD